MCFGVRDAIALAMKQSNGQPLTILGELVHNEAVLQTLRNSGIQFAKPDDSLRTERVMITAHGTSQRIVSELKIDGHIVIEATCPLVHFAHRALHNLVGAGFHPVIIGRAEHVEVRGMTGDLTDYDVISSEAEIASLTERPRFGIVSQTTQPIQKVRYLVELIRQRFPKSEVKFSDTVCQPTKNRQSAAVDLAKKCDLVIVIGGAHSNNTRELVSSCKRFCERVFHAQSADDLQIEWFADVEEVGITAGTSTPDSIIHEVERRIHEFARKRDEDRFVMGARERNPLTFQLNTGK